MEAARLHTYGESLRLEDVEEPKIEHPFDVIVRVGGAALSRFDAQIIKGQWAPIQDQYGTLLPYTLGTENAGWIEEVGSAVTNVTLGDAVIVHPLITCGFCRPCRAGDDMHCENGEFSGLSRDGGFAELFRTSARAVVKLPAGVKPKYVAAHAVEDLTAYHAVKKAAHTLLPGTRAVVIGAGGGPGHFGIQCLKAMTPAEIVAIDGRERALRLAQACRADHLVQVDGSQVRRCGK
jgi:NAD+-dependent secondary alcohol dehydrogenase Adh1